jgi:hypothetical protein
MKFLTPTHLAQLKQILTVGLGILFILFVLGRLTEGFVGEVTFDKYVNYKEPTQTFSLQELKAMAQGKKKLQKIEFYDYYSKGGKSGFILKDSPEVQPQSQSKSTGPFITFTSTKNPFFDEFHKPDDKKIKEDKTRLPIELDDERMKAGITIQQIIPSNFGGDLIGSKSQYRLDAKKNKIANIRFESGNVSPTDPGKGQELMIRFYFTD